MSAPSSSRSRRKTATVLGKDYAEATYNPQFALGVLCLDEAEQQKLFKRLRRVLPGKEIKVLVI